MDSLLHRNWNNPITFFYFYLNFYLVHSDAKKTKVSKKEDSSQNSVFLREKETEEEEEDPSYRSGSEVDEVKI